MRFLPSSTPANLSQIARQKHRSPRRQFAWVQTMIRVCSSTGYSPGASSPSSSSSVPSSSDGGWRPLRSATASAAKVSGANSWSHASSSPSRAAKWAGQGPPHHRHGTRGWRPGRCHTTCLIRSPHLEHHQAIAEVPEHRVGELSHHKRRGLGRGLSGGPIPFLEPSVDVGDGGATGVLASHVGLAPHVVPGRQVPPRCSCQNRARMGNARPR